MLAIIPARGGSKGVPGKNAKTLAGLPLIAHSILLAALCPSVSRVVVSTDSEEIAAVARRYGAEVPFVRPAALAQDETPMWPVIRHAVEALANYEVADGIVLLLDPTTIGRLPEDIEGARRVLGDRPDADGVVGVSRAAFNPIWHCVIERDGWMAPLIPDGEHYGRRQDVPAVFRINASLYLWRTTFVRREPERWRRGRLLLYEVPEWRMIHIDTPEDFRRADLLVQERFIRLPWIEGTS